MIYVGIDPGKNGATAVLTPDDLKLGDKDLLRNAIFRHPVSDTRYKFFMENVHSMPTDGTKSAHSFGVENGFIHGMFFMFGGEPIMVTPVEWQRFYVPLGIPGNRKNMLKEKAKELFPEYAKQITLKNCDAILIAHYGKYFYKEKA